MEKLIIFFLCVLILTGCGSSKVVDEKKDNTSYSNDEQSVQISTNGATIKVNK